MLVGPVFTRELATAPRRPRLFLHRAIYAAALFLLMCTAWLVLAGTQVIRGVGDMARFGTIFFQIIAPLQLALAVFFAALVSASAVAQEKDRKTLILLLMTRLTNSELVLGRLMASLLNIIVMLAAGLPVFMFALLFGGISFGQVVRVFAVTLATTLAAGSLGSMLALWREKTFQTLALTALILVFWIGAWEAVGAGALGARPAGVDRQSLSVWFSPLRAVLTAARPNYATSVWSSDDPINVYLLVSAGITLVLNAVAIVRVRVWNPSREVRQMSEADAAHESIWGPAVAEEIQGTESHASARAERAEKARAGHVDAQLRGRTAGTSREVWDNPVLWREVRTWAYGRKVLVIRLAYGLLFALALVASYWVMQNEAALQTTTGLGSVVHASARPLVPFFVLSLVIINALAVTSVTNERDGRSLDLLLVTDLSPREFLVGKMGGVFWNTREMVLLPLALCLYVWWNGRLATENLCYVVGGLLVMNLFVATLGIHCGMAYANSRTAIGVSLGTVFFLFLGVLTCILMMISFSGSFQIQLAPFLAFILGGGIGLFVSLGARNPSAAIGTASLLLPFATFYAIVSFLMDQTLGVFLVTALTYGFTTAAMLVPALSEFDFAMGRSSTQEE